MPAKLYLFQPGQEGKIVMTAGETPRLPDDLDAEQFESLVDSWGLLARDDGGDRWGELKKDALLPEGWVCCSRRELPALLGYQAFSQAGLAFQLMNWTLTHRFCGRCGSAMVESAEERAMNCAVCGHVAFPVLAPAVIVAVERDGALLLGHNANFPAGRYSVLAGFVEPGESLEEAVAREIFEESGVRVKNIRYFGSQPWPFPNSLMIGFHADWLGEEPQADGKELTDVRFFTPDEMPEIPPSISISRKLIDDWLLRQKQV